MSISAVFDLVDETLRRLATGRVDLPSPAEASEYEGSGQPANAKFYRALQRASARIAGETTAIYDELAELHEQLSAVAKEFRETEENSAAEMDRLSAIVDAGAREGAALDRSGQPAWLALATEARTTASTPATVQKG